MRTDTLTGWIVLLIAAVALLGPAGCGSAGGTGEAGEADEETIGEITDKMFLPSSLAFSKDFKHIAYAVRVGKRQRILIDGEKQPVYDGIMIGTPMFIGDTERVIYIAKDNAPGSDKEGEEEERKREGEKWYVVFGQKEHKKYDFILPYSIKVSPDGKRIVYAAREGRAQYLIEDAEEFEGGEGIDVKSITFSENSERLVYIYRKERKFYISDKTINEGPYTFIDSDSVTLSPDGRHLAYVIRDEDRKTFIVVDGKQFGPYNRTVGPEPDRGRRRGGPGMGRDMRSQAEKGPKGIRFTAGGDLLFYGLRDGTIYRVVVDLK
jgi:hypothetical protein